VEIKETKQNIDDRDGDKELDKCILENHKPITYRGTP
jgi:hypothetical protein